MLDLLDRMPAPQVRRLRRAPARCLGLASNWWARIAVKCSSAMVAARLTIGGFDRVTASRFSTCASSFERSYPAVAPRAC